jgi:hypothetical protein
LIHFAMPGISAPWKTSPSPIFPFAMNSYAAWSGDLDALLEMPNGYHAKCQAFDRFWIAAIS